MTHIVLEAMDILDLMGISYAALAGGDLCCGAGPMLVGDTNGSQKASRELVGAISAFRPKRAVFYCLGCPSILRRALPQPGGSPVEYQWLSQFLVENVDRLPFKEKLNKKVALHDSCITVSTPNSVEITRTLLRSIPGVTLVEMAHNRQNALCCGGATTASRPEIGKRLRRAPMDEAKAAGADILATQCSGCHQAYAPLEHAFPFEVKSYVSVMAEALGVQHEDKFKKYANYRDLNRVLDESRECVSASDYSEDEIRRFLSDRWKCELGVCSGCRFAGESDRGCIQPGVNDERSCGA
jgi:Fe-S oxidoreductase